MIHNLNDFGIEDLMVVGVHWPRVQKEHLRQMSDLKVVNLSGNDISSIDNGKQRFDHNLTDAKIYLAGTTFSFIRMYHFLNDKARKRGTYYLWSILMYRPGINF